MLYKIVYEDLTTHIGKDINNTGWNQINKPILYIEYCFGAKIVTLSGFEQYCHIVEALKNNRGEVRIDKIKLFAKKDLACLIFIYDIATKVLYRDTQPYDKMSAKYSGWKIGIKTNLPEAKIK